MLVQGVRVPRLTETRHLGVVLTSKLTWGAHIQCVVSKALPEIVLLKRMAYCLNLPAFTIRRCYIALARPFLEYASPVWNNCTKVDTLRLEKLQLAVARAVLRLRHRGAMQSSLLVLAGPLWLGDGGCILYCCFGACDMERVPVLAAALPAPASERAPQYALRKSADVELPACHSKQHISSFLPAAAIWWNSLPSALHFVSSLP